ncbi:probable cytochrome P450 6a21 [Teleopsis dalmanni]|uniref:probable cytochrome P450 6a21 n=1 Tax=Teleopsis dalmanni TaxID=139649 RepID=UPI0018CD9D23|nr:probable cytochrome P450 6a21 [Teleopsis dalmanni]
MSVCSVLIYGLIGLILYCLHLMKKRLNYWQSRGIACEEPHFIFGNLHGIRKTRSFNDVWTHYYQKFKGTGPFAGFYWFQKPAVFVLDTTLAKNILIKDFAKFTDRGFYSNEKDDPLTGQLFLLDGHKWRRMRNKLSPTFTSGKMKFMFPTVVKVGEEFINVFGGMVNKSAVIEVKELLARFTMDVIGTCAFGIDCCSLRDPKAEIYIMGKRSLTDTRHGSIGIAFVSSFPELAQKLGMKQTPTHIEEFFMRIVRETVDHRERNNIRRNDFMDMLIDMKNNKLLKSEDGEHMSNLTIEELTAQAFVFFAAGFETSSTTMGFALFELAQNQDIQEKLRTEVRNVFSKYNDQFSYECMKDMHYLDQVISETLRLYTVLPVLNRKSLEDYVVPDNPKYVIKKGTPILIPAGAIHRDEKYYPNPNQFNPDNFSPDKVKERDTVEWLPFGDGPRNCIGMRFGQMQSRIGLAYLLRDFRFSVCKETIIPMKYDKKSFLISSEGGIYLKVEKI